MNFAPHEFDREWRYQDPLATELVFKEYEKLLNVHDDRTLLPQLFTQLARCRSLLRDKDGSEAYLQTAHSLIESLDTSEQIVPRIRYHLEKGRLLNALNIEDRGAEDFLSAWNDAITNHCDFYAIDAAHMLGIVKNGDESLDWNFKAMKHAEQSQDMKAKSWLGALYNNIGWTLHGLQRYDEALQCFLNDEAWYRERHRHEEALIAHWSMAKMLRLLNRPDEALRELYVIAEERKERNLPNDGYLSEEIAECLLAKGQVDHSAPFFASAYEILCEDEWLMQHEQARMERLKLLGNVKTP